MAKLTMEQKGRIDDVLYTLRCAENWVNPMASLQACIQVLSRVKDSLAEPTQ
jgi:hypothetical protein